jgi:hypothetical protein
MSIRIQLTLALLVAPSIVSAAGAFASEAILEGTVPREACIERHAQRRPFFGDLHVHTVLSLDASTMGTRNRPADAYRFARGEKLGIQPYHSDGTPIRSIRLSRPLDFAAVTDHAELLGEWNTCNTPGLPGHDSWVCRVYRNYPRIAFFYMNYTSSQARRHDFCGDDGSICLAASRAPWTEIQEAAEQAYDRTASCSFTAFKAYEWTGGVGSTGNNFHRNVIFANDVVPDLPISFVDQPILTDFWASLGRSCSDAAHGCDVVVIPHNSNLSGGLMFQTERPDGTPIQADEARARARYEVMVEIMQHKGESECMLGVGTEDELCGFENLAMSSFAGRFMAFRAEPPMPRQFVRHILKVGLEQERRLGVNPFKFGIIASTDTHLGTPGHVNESADYPGHGGAGKPAEDELPVGFPDHLDFNPGGLAGLWAEENSRTSLFAAMKRKESFGTSGPRMVVRLFGGWSYSDDLCASPDFAKLGYTLGVPMGSDLMARPTADGPGPGPVFAVSALADPGVAGAPGTPLQRIQIIKGWLDEDGTHEAIYDVAGDPENGASVSLDTCEARGPNVRSLCSVWRDPDFDPAEPAFYYARVIENPTCRWSQRLCIASGAQCGDPGTLGKGLEPCCAEEHQPIIQERGWTSPIWYRPDQT